MGGGAVVPKERKKQAEGVWVTSHCLLFTSSFVMPLN